MEVHTNVAESDIGRLKPGMRVSFTVDAYPGEPFRGAIRDIRNAPQVVQNVVTYDAVIDVANDELKLKPGMTATVSVVTDRAAKCGQRAQCGAALPTRRPSPPGAAPAAGNAQAARRTARKAAAAGAGDRQRRERGSEDDEARARRGKRTVYVVEVNGKPEPREVTTGISDGRVTEITGGELKEGENVIVSLAGQNAGSGARRGSARGFRIL